MQAPKEKFINDLALFLYETVLNDHTLAKPHSNEIQNNIWNMPYLQQKIIQPLTHRIGHEATVQKFNEVFNAVATDVKNRYGIIFEDEEEEIKELDINPDEEFDSCDAFEGIRSKKEIEEPFADYEEAGFDPVTGILKNVNENVVDDVLDWWHGQSDTRGDITFQDKRYDSVDDYVDFYISKAREAKKNPSVRIPLCADDTSGLDYTRFYSMVCHFSNPNPAMRNDFIAHFGSGDLEQDEADFNDAYHQIKVFMSGAMDEDNEQLYVGPASYGTMGI